MKSEAQKLAKHIFVILVTISSATAALAGQVGNGGKGVICRDRDGTIQSAQLLDFFEQRSFGEEIKVPAGQDPFAIADALLHRLTTNDPVRAESYRKILTKLTSDLYTNWTNEVLHNTNDSTEVVTPPAGCETAQLAVQRLENGVLVKNFTLQRTLFAALPLADQAGLLVHEVIYFDALRRGHVTSRSVREMNAFLASDKVSDYLPAAYADFLEQIDLSTFVATAGNGGLAIVPARHADFDLASAWCKDIWGGDLISQETLVTHHTFINQHYASLLRANNGDIWIHDRNQSSGAVQVYAFAVLPPRPQERTFEDKASIACWR